MENMSQPPNSELQASTEQPLPTPARPATGRLKIPLLVCGGVLILMCICVGLGTLVFGLGLFGASNAKMEDAVQVVDNYMKAMEIQDSPLAYEFFSKRAQRQFPRSNLESLLHGANFVLFDGYQTIKVTSWKVGPQVNTNPDVPQGTVAQLAGSITYEGGFTGQFQAVLELENNEWKLDGINVTVSPNKMENFTNGH